MQTDTASATTTTFLYDGDNLSAEYSSAGAVLRRYVPSGLGIDQPLVWYEGAGTTDRRWLHADNQGSIIAYSNASGDETAAYGYSPYGEPGAWSASRYAYTGQLMIPENSLYNYKARAYDPKLGRFLQTDPIGVAGGMNLYAYVGNGATYATDPSGAAEEPDKLNEDGGHGDYGDFSDPVAAAFSNSGGSGLFTMTNCASGGFDPVTNEVTVPGCKTTTVLIGDGGDSGPGGGAAAAAGGGGGNAKGAQRAGPRQPPCNKTLVALGTTMKDAAHVGSKLSSGAEAYGLFMAVTMAPESVPSEGTSEIPGGLLIKAGAAGNLVSAGMDLYGGLLQGVGSNNWGNFAHSALITATGVLTTLALGGTNKLGALVGGSAVDSYTAAGSPDKDPAPTCKLEGE